MKQYEDNKKPNRKKDHKKNKTKRFIDEEKIFESKSNKEFKYRKKYLAEDDDEEDWENYT